METHFSHGDAKIMGFGRVVGGKSASLRRCRVVAGRNLLRAGVATATVLTAGGLVFAASADAEPAAAGGAAPTVSPGRAVGQRRPVNSGTDGQCTWGALQKWFEAGGYYPALEGNAADWADSARAHGWTVVTDPQPRAIVVFQPWLPGVSPYGHAAWVNAVSERGDGTWVNITEMNNGSHGGAGQWWTRDAMNVPGMSYILMP